MSRDRFRHLTVEGFTLYDGEESHRTFEEAELMAHAASLGRNGTQQAMVLVSLGIDQQDLNVVQVDHFAGTYGTPLAAITEAIATLELIRDQLDVMASVPDAKAREKNTFDIGVDAQRHGLVIPSQEARA